MQKGAGPEILRPLGACEEMFAVCSNAGFSTFSIVAKLYGEITTECLQFGLDGLQECHQKLNLAIRQGSDGRRFFVYGEKYNPLTVMDSKSTTWEKATLRDLEIPFTPERGGLFRVTALLG